MGVGTSGLSRIACAVAALAAATVPVGTLGAHSARDGTHDSTLRALGARHAPIRTLEVPPGTHAETLENGLRVLVRPLPEGTDVAIVLVFDIGEQHDPEGASGLAHLIEHLWVTAAAGDLPSRTADAWMHAPGRRTGANAQTGETYTLVASVVPAMHWQVELRDFAARLNGPKVTQADLDRELPRMSIELGNMYGGMPRLAALNIARQTAVPAPSGGRRGGVEAQLAQVTLEQVQARLATLYGAANATLAVAGPVEAAFALDLVRALFASAPTGKPPPHARARAQPAALGVAWADFHGSSGAPQAAHAATDGVAATSFAAPLPTHPDYPAFVLAVSAMAAAPTTADRASVPTVVFTPLDDPSTVTFICAPVQPDETEEAIVAATRSPIDALMARPAAALARARATQTYASMLGVIELPPAALAMNPYFAAMLLARHEQLRVDSAAIAQAMAAATHGDMLRVAATWFAADQGRTAIAGTPPAPLPVRTARKAVEALQARALHAGRVDWPAVSAELATSVERDASLDDARAFIRRVIALLNDPHTRYEVPAPAAPTPKPEPAPTPKPTPAPTPPTPPADARVTPALPSARMLDGNVAYIQLPPCTDTSAPAVQAYAGALLGACCEVGAQRPAGYIVDLRLNGGGTMWPMIAGLHPILGDGACGGSESRAGDRTRYGLERRPGSAEVVAWLARGDSRQDQLVTAAHTCSLAAAPVAVLIGPWTMSSGEIVAAALAKCPRVRTFGEATAGLATATEPVSLPDGSTLILATESVFDARGKPIAGAIAPDHVVTWVDWPTSDDQAVQAARQWLLSTDSTPSRPTPQPTR